MNKNLFAAMLVILFLVTIGSCDYSTKSALVHIYNDSQYPVTEIAISTRSDQWFMDILEPGENCTLLYEWVESNTWYTKIYFTMNGEDYGTLGADQINDDTPDRYKPYKHVTNGDTIIVRIYDDHWEW